MVLTSFNFKGSHTVTTIFVFNANYTVNHSLYAVSLRIELLFRSDKVIVL